MTENTTGRLTVASINGRQVSFFAPPHTEPDFPWVDAMQLISAFMSPAGAALLLKSTHRFADGKAVLTVRDGDRLTTIMCHAMAQGICGAIDQQLNGVDEDGPAFRAYCSTAGKVAAKHWPMELPDFLAAYHNQGGPFMRDGRTES